MKVYRVYVTGVDTDGREYEDTKGIFTSKEKAEEAIAYGKITEQRNCNGGFWHCEEYRCNVYDEMKEF